MSQWIDRNGYGSKLSRGNQQFWDNRITHLILTYIQIAIPECRWESIHKILETQNSIFWRIPKCRKLCRRAIFFNPRIPRFPINSPFNWFWDISTWIRTLVIVCVPVGFSCFSLNSLHQAVVALNTTRRCPCSFTKISLGLGRYITVIILVGGIPTPLKNISQFGMIIPIYYGK